ncbi:hypothetical protein Sj15T_09860 [Sphingobium sp. TA15]|uniref:Putative type I restriction-modification system methyltransferase subunit n=1 Tax=Sphingobium indicum (strain DSM 16413 / CCM 7287 / MTCC 6362 / UT26 / NBRC 101211 / UT26S) TaxID=452662 RepID=D4Z251_SPHIU|nr:N-6 DNA methylase [Sphingobium indicum]BAI96683.1 putative type I restriction-modification system methyltransferase subunit [Sphingobium indicum UT26S]BDD65965.1 hypothetical protein Sj15T_09860 [Sphingobium sp. TA15]
MATQSEHIKNALKLFRSTQYRHDLHTLFSDCMEMMATSISNAVDLRSKDAREQRYLEIVGRYDRQVVDTFPRIFAEVTMALESEPGDVLGAIFGELELHNAARGQFFTPYSVCRMMAEATGIDSQEMRDIIACEGFVTAMEPACGAGAMVIALAETMRGADINYQRHLHVTAVDIDRRAVHMCYIQLSLLHVPAVVIVGDSLSLKMQDYWYTPAHILGGWTQKLANRHRRPSDDDASPAIVRPSPHDAGPRIVIGPPGRRGEQLTLF